jgi:hypothetical protein
MNNNEYRFTTRWRVRGTTCERVSDVLGDMDRIPHWWSSVYRECNVVEPGGAHGLGRRVAVTTKGFLPYAIRWRFSVVEECYPHGSRIVADGDLEGEGRWTLTQDGDDVAITYDWRVRANKPLLRRFGRWLRPLFAANHNYTMRQGLRGLRAELAGRPATSVRHGERRERRKRVAAGAPAAHEKVPTRVQRFDKPSSGRRAAMLPKKQLRASSPGVHSGAHDCRLPVDS